MKTLECNDFPSNTPAILSRSWVLTSLLQGCGYISHCWPKLFNEAHALGQWHSSVWRPLCHPQMDTMGNGQFPLLEEISCQLRSLITRLRPPTMKQSYLNVRKMRVSLEAEYCCRCSRRARRGKAAARNASDLESPSGLFCAGLLWVICLQNWGCDGASVCAPLRSFTMA